MEKPVSEALRISDANRSQRQMVMVVVEHQFWGRTLAVLVLVMTMTTMAVVVVVLMVVMIMITMMMMMAVVVVVVMMMMMMMMSYSAAAAAQPTSRSAAAALGPGRRLRTPSADGAAPLSGVQHSWFLLSVELRKTTTTTTYKQEQIRTMYMRTSHVGSRLQHR